MLPFEAKMLRRLNSHYQSFVGQITLLHQFQRQKDEFGRLIATVEDLELGCEILFDAIILKVDELDSSTRQFFEDVKKHVKKQSNPNYLFTQRDIRHALNQGKTTCFNYMETLLKLEYIQIAEGSANRGFRYRIVFWDDMDKIRTKVKQELLTQIKSLKQ